LEWEIYPVIPDEKPDFNELVGFSINWTSEPIESALTREEAETVLREYWITNRSDDFPLNLDLNSDSVCITVFMPGQHSFGAMINCYSENRSVTVTFRNLRGTWTLTDFRERTQ